MEKKRTKVLILVSIFGIFSHAYSFLVDVLLLVSLQTNFFSENITNINQYHLKEAFKMGFTREQIIFGFVPSVIWNIAAIFCFVGVLRLKNSWRKRLLFLTFTSIVYTLCWVYFFAGYDIDISYILGTLYIALPNGTPLLVLIAAIFILIYFTRSKVKVRFS